MSWITWVIVGALILVFYGLKRLSLIAPEKAREAMRAGATVIDVRTREEFGESKLPGVINIPLNQLRDQISRHVPNKDQTILLHCLSGSRSGVGKSILKGMGYSQCFNLGSYGRARKILSGCPGKTR